MLAPYPAWYLILYCIYALSRYEEVNGTEVVTEEHKVSVSQAVVGGVRWSWLLHLSSPNEHHSS
jgi:hypothetical protein